MEKQNFKVIDEEFVCENCGALVPEDCKGLLEPVGMEPNSKKGYMIIFKCKKCGMIRKNKAAEDDDMDLLIKLSAKHDY